MNINEMTTTQVSTEKGFSTRAEYLESLAKNFKFSIVFVTELADAYDESEDFEGLIKALSIYSDEPLENQIDEIIQDGIKDLNQIEDEGDKQIYDMVANCMEREAKEASISVQKEEYKWLTTTFHDNWEGDKTRSFFTICDICGKSLGEHSERNRFCPSN